MTKTPIFTSVGLSVKKHRRCRLDNAGNGTGCPAHEGRERQNIPFAFVWTLTHCSHDGALYKSTFYLLTYLLDRAHR